MIWLTFLSLFSAIFALAAGQPQQQQQQHIIPNRPHHNGPIKYQQGIPLPPQQVLHLQQQYKQNYPEDERDHPVRGVKKQYPQQQRYKPSSQQQQQAEQLTSSEERELAEQEEDQKPDRLTELLATSKFECNEKKNGYYADNGLNCEVFHYCQDGKKHSWLCPNEFAFHQIHLICVPPSSTDNICQKSQDYYFVNDFLYKPVNEKQAAQYNTSLRYADRFFPQNYQINNAPLSDEDYYEDEEEVVQGRPHQAPIHHPPPQQQVHHRPRPIPSNEHHGHGHGKGPQKVFFNPGEINIPLSQRRPIPSPQYFDHNQQSKPNNFRPSAQVLRLS